MPKNNLLSNSSNRILKYVLYIQWFHDTSQHNVVALEHIRSYNIISSIHQCLQAGHHNHILLIPKCHLWGTQSAPSPKCLGHHQYHPAHHWVCHWYLIVRSGVVQTVIPHTNNFYGGKIVLQWLTFTMSHPNFYSS